MTINDKYEAAYTAVRSGLNAHSIEEAYPHFYRAADILQDIVGYDRSKLIDRALAHDPIPIDELRVDAAGRPG